MNDLPIILSYEVKGFDKVERSSLRILNIMKDLDKTMISLSKSSLIVAANMAKINGGNLKTYIKDLTDLNDKLLKSIKATNNQSSNYSRNRSFAGVNVGANGISTFGGMSFGMGGGPAAAALIVGKLVVDAIRDGFKTVVEFDKVTTKIAAVGGMTKEEKDLFVRNTLEMSKDRTLGMTPTELADAQYKAVTAGFTGGALTKVTPTIAKFAKANDIQGEEATNILTAGLFQFKGGDPNQMKNVANEYTKIASMTRTGVKQIAEATKNVGTVAKNYGVTIEQTLGSVGMLGQLGVEGGKAGTHTKIMMQRLYAPNKMSSNALQELNISSYNKDGTTKDFQKLLKEIKDKTSGMSEASKNSVLKRLFGSEASASATGILNNLNRLDEYTKQLADNSNDLNDKIANEMSKTVSASIDRLKSAWNRYVLEIENGSGPISRMIKGIADMATQILEFDWKDFLLYSAGFMVGGAYGGDLALKLRPDESRKYAKRVADKELQISQQNVDTKKIQKILASKSENLMIEEANLIDARINQIKLNKQNLKNALSKKWKNLAAPENVENIAENVANEMLKSSMKDLKKLEEYRKTHKTADQLDAENAASEDKIANAKQDALAAEQKYWDKRKLLILGMSSGFEQTMENFKLNYQLQVKEFEKAGFKEWQYSGWINDQFNAKLNLENEDINKSIQNKIDLLQAGKKFDPYSIQYNKPENNIRSVTFEIKNGLNVESLTEKVSMTKEELAKLMQEAFNTMVANMQIAMP